MKRLTWLLLIIIYSCSTAEQPNQDQNTEEPSNSEFTIDRVLLDSFILSKMEEEGIPALSIAIVKNSSFLYSKSFGVLDQESERRVNSNTLFEAASLSKPVFAYLALQLSIEGILDLDKPLYEYLPYPDIEKDDRYKQITARMALSHTSGFPNWRRNKPLSINFEPGSQFSYSGEGYMYLQQVIEKLTAQSLSDLMDKRLFTNKGMDDSHFEWNDSLAINLASGYARDGSKKKKWKPQEAWAAGSLHTTANDFARFLTEIFKNEDILKMMVKPESSIAEYDDQLSWGLGLGLQKTSTELSFWHWGSNDGYKSFVVGYPDQKIAFVYLTSSDKGLNIVDDLTCQILGENNYPAFDWLNTEHQYPIKALCE